MIGDTLCQGCISSTTDGLVCTVPPTCKGKRCPCLDCIVKGICIADSSECELVSDYNEYCEKNGVGVTGEGEP
jgi:hypothetical protein